MPVHELLTYIPVHSLENNGLEKEGKTTVVNENVFLKRTQFLSRSLFQAHVFFGFGSNWKFWKNLPSNNGW